jgi:hypothetical protein
MPMKDFNILMPQAPGLKPYPFESYCKLFLIHPNKNATTTTSSH